MAGIPAGRGHHRCAGSHAVTPKAWYAARVTSAHDPAAGPSRSVTRPACEFIGRSGRSRSDRPHPCGRYPDELSSAPALPLTWLGHATVRFRFDATTVLTDPVLGRWVGPLAARDQHPAHAATGTDLVLLSHARHDHLDLASLRLLPPTVLVVLPRGLAPLARAAGSTASSSSTPARCCAWLSWTVTAVPAEHSGTPSGSSLHAPALGYLLHGSRTVYVAGDTSRSRPGRPRPPGRPGPRSHRGWGPRSGRGHLDAQQAARPRRSTTSRRPGPLGHVRRPTQLGCCCRGLLGAARAVLPSPPPRPARPALPARGPAAWPGSVLTSGARPATQPTPDLVPRRRGAGRARREHGVPAGRPGPAGGAVRDPAVPAAGDPRRAGDRRRRPDDVPDLRRACRRQLPGYDKALDIYYLAIAYASTLRNWRDPFAFDIAALLWYYRLVGALAFELTGAAGCCWSSPTPSSTSSSPTRRSGSRWDPRAAVAGPLLVSPAGHLGLRQAAAGVVDPRRAASTSPTRSPPTRGWGRPAVGSLAAGLALAARAATARPRAGRRPWPSTPTGRPVTSRRPSAAAVRSLPFWTSVSEKMLLCPWSPRDLRQGAGRPRHRHPDRAGVACWCSSTPAVSQVLARCGTSWTVHAAPVPRARRDQRGMPVPSWYLTVPRARRRRRPRHHVFLMLLSV